MSKQALDFAFKLVGQFSTVYVGIWGECLQFPVKF